MESGTENKIVRPAMIDNSTLADYLIGFSKSAQGRPFEAKKEHFAPEMDVGEQISEVIKQMYEITPMNTMTGEEGEQARIVYGLPRSGEMRATRINYGTETEVGLQELQEEVVDKGGQIMLQIHTHPHYPVLFSAEDYEGMLLQIDESKRRLVRGIIVLVKERQILALATSDTPLIPSVAAIKQMILELNQKNEDLLLQERMDGMMAGLPGHKLEDKLWQATNNFRYEIAQKMGVKLYSSTDMRRFSEFSA